jgi:hypothetical protein
MKKGRLGFGLAVVSMISIGASARADIRFTQTIRTADGEVRREILLRADRRRIETKPVDWKGGPGEDARLGAAIEITRLDRKETWRLDPDTKRYEALPLQRAKERASAGGGKTLAEQDLLRAHYRPGEAEITVGRPEPAGKIAGFATERVRLKRVVPLRSASSARAARVELVMDAWITRDPKILAEVGRFEGADRPGSAESLVPIRTRSGAVIGGLAPQVTALNAQLRALGGYPLNTSLTVTWESPDASAKRHAARPSVGTMAIEVTAVSFEPLADSVFEIPAGYQLAGAPAPAAVASPVNPGTPAVPAPGTAAMAPRPAVTEAAPRIAAPPATERTPQRMAVPTTPQPALLPEAPPAAVAATRIPPPPATPAPPTAPLASGIPNQPVAAPAAVPTSPSAAALKPASGDAPGMEAGFTGTAAEEPRRRGRRAIRHGKRHRPRAGDVAY